MKEIKCIECDRIFNSKEASDMHNKSKHPEKVKKSLINLTYKTKRRILTFGRRKKL